MGCLSRVWCLTKLLLVCLFITFLPGIPPNADYKEYKAARPRSLDAELLARTYLDGAERLFEGEMTGPEAFAMYNGAVYTGIHGGWVVKVEEGKITPIVKFGKDCDDIIEEDKCGRPLGMEFDRAGTLYVADAYYGIFKYEFSSGKKTLLVDANDEIEGKKSVFINDLTVSKDGTVYFTVSSTSFPLYDGLHAVLAAGDGRIVKYDPRSKEATVLSEGLILPNGIVLSPDEDCLIFNELAMARVMKYNLKGAKQGTIEVFAEGLPGLPDNIRIDGQGGYYVSLVVPADETHPAVPLVLGPFPNIRKFLARVLYLLELPFVQINNLYPNDFCQRTVHAIGHLSPTRFLSPGGVTILHLDSQGRIKDALIGKDGSVNHISDMIITGNHILLGSPYNNYIGRVRRPDAPYQIHVKSIRYEEATPEEKKRDEAMAERAAEEARVKKARDEAAARKVAEDAAKAKRVSEEAAQKAAVEAQLKKNAEAAAKKAAEEAKARLVAEEAKKKAAEEAKKRAAEEARIRKAAEEAKARKAAEESARRAAEEAKLKKLAEEARVKKAADEANARKVAEEIKLKKAAEESAKQKKAEGVKTN